MIEKGEAKEGYHSYFRIAVRRTRGGLPPSPTMAKDLKKLAKAAGLDPNEEEKNFIQELLAAPALRMASDGFWKAYKKAIVALTKEDEKYRALVLDLFPKTHPRKWFEILDACNATDALHDDNSSAKARSKYSTSEWFTKILGQQNDLGWWRSGDDTAERILSLLETCADRLREDGLAIELPAHRVGFDPDVVELGLSLGLEFKVDPEGSFSNMDRWASHHEKEGRGRDWVSIAENKIFREFALKAIASSTYRLGGWVHMISTRPSLKSLTGIWLEDFIGKTEGKGELIDSERVLNQFTNFPQLLWKEFPEHFERLLRANFAVQLRKTLEVGLLDEYGWPALDAVLDDFGRQEDVRYAGFYPFLVVYDEVKFVVLGPEGVKLKGELPKHAGYPVDDIIYSQDTVLFIFKKSWGDWKVQWLGKKAFNLNEVPNYRFQSVMLPDSRVVFNGCRVFTPGDQAFDDNNRRSMRLVSDGNNFWKALDLYEGRKKYMKMNLLDGKKIPNEDVPFLVEDGEHFLGDLRRLVHLEDDSPLYSEDGLFGLRWTRRK